VIPHLKEKAKYADCNGQQAQQGPHWKDTYRGAGCDSKDPNTENKYSNRD
jgi:hypothetical protein